MKNVIKIATLALAASGLAATAVPASAADFAPPAVYSAAPVADTWNQSWRDRRWERRQDRRERRWERRHDRRDYGERVYRHTRVSR